MTKHQKSDGELMALVDARKTDDLSKREKTYVEKLRRECEERYEDEFIAGTRYCVSWNRSDEPNEISCFDVEQIRVRPGRRGTDARRVKEIADSIKRSGMLSPPIVTVRKTNVVVDDAGREGFDEEIVLIAGRHRLDAWRSLGHREISCLVVDATEIQAELMEIDENLARAQLSPAERVAQTKRRQVLWDQEKATVAAAAAESGANCATLEKPKTGRGNKQFAAETAAISGTTKSSVNRDIARAEALGDDLIRVAGTSLDTGVELDAMKNMPEPARKELIDRAVAGEQVSARVKLAEVPHSAVEPAVPAPAPIGMRPTVAADDADEEEFDRDLAMVRAWPDYYWLKIVAHRRPAAANDDDLKLAA